MHFRITLPRSRRKTQKFWEFYQNCTEYSYIYISLNFPLKFLPCLSSILKFSPQPFPVLLDLFLGTSCFYCIVKSIYLIAFKKFCCWHFEIQLDFVHWFLYPENAKLSNLYKLSNNIQTYIYRLLPYSSLGRQSYNPQIMIVYFFLSNLLFHYFIYMVTYLSFISDLTTLLMLN